MLCKIGNCKEHGEELSIWFTLNYFVNKDDPESIRQFHTYLKSGGKTLPKGELKDFIKDEKAVSPENDAAKNELLDRIDEVLSNLSEREAQVIRLRFGIDDGYAHTLDQIGRTFGVSRERIRQIEERALNKLRHPVRIRKLEDFI